MNRIFIIFFLIIAGVCTKFYFNKVHDCVGTPDGVTLPKIFRIKRGEPIKLKFDMNRIPVVGCLEKHTSPFYKHVSCGYKLVTAENWAPGKIVRISDTELSYSVECQIPTLGATSIDATTMEYYFEYSAWGKPLVRENRSLIIEDPPKKL
ncbi:MAG: hypothetical protein K2Q18_14375 [Bdellovibrionales bacterium]|nr:hypothetical protein [Bdellovibrionales bacterium]